MFEYVDRFMRSDRIDDDEIESKYVLMALNLPYMKRFSDVTVKTTYRKFEKKEDLEFGQKNMDKREFTIN
jgi:hypothetical protein